jgi:serine/threonine protein kinase
MEAGERIGPYTVLRELGRGGMGTVYEVEDPSLHRSAALKVVHSGLATPDTLTRFRREAEAMARVRHHNLVRIFKVGQATQGSYLLMELVDGSPLSALVESPESSFPPRRAAKVVRQLASAAEALHREGILHRDLKPSNVILRPDGVPVLLDLGLARVTDAETLTRTGAVIGTVGYMSPEQAKGVSPKTLTPAVDVYGLGVILYELLAGEAPFRGRPMKVLKAIVSQEPPWPPELEAKVPKGLQRIVLRALAKDPQQRYASAADLGEALARFLEGQGERPRWQVLLGYVAVGALATGALAGVVFKLVSFLG